MSYNIPYDLSGFFVVLPLVNNLEIAQNCNRCLCMTLREFLTGFPRAIELHLIYKETYGDSLIHMKPRRTDTG